MPLNEASAIRRSSLTTQQKREAEAAIFGLQPNHMEIAELTPQEIERMRALVAAHDRTQGKIQEFDLNRPPQEPLQYRPYPKLIYHHGTRTHKLIQNEEQLEAHMAEGWDTRPYPAEPPAPVQLDAAAAAEAAEVNQQLAQLRKKK